MNRGDKFGSKLKSLAIIFTLLISVLNISATPKSQDNREVIGGKYTATISTSMGKIVVLLYDQTPLHRDNFIELINEEYYNGLLFHRVISDFVIQAGDPDSRNAKAGAKLGEGDNGKTVMEEIKPYLRHHRGVLAAAREADDVNPDRLSSSSHFYITLKEQHRLDGAYTVFGEVIKGEKVMDKIAEMEVDENDRPLKDVVINDIKLKKLNKPISSKLQ